jgi:hypothetical protein
MISEILLWLFAINLGVVVGAGLYEHRIVVPIWASAPPQSFGKPEVGLRFWLYVTTIPLTFLTLANNLAAWMYDGAARTWWLAATLIIVAERIATFTYFVPTLLALQNEQSSAPDALSRFARWRTMNLVRVAVAIAAWLAALKALTILA